MNTVVHSDPRIQEVQVTEYEIVARLVDGRVVSVPLAWSWRLSEATPAQRANFRLIGTGQGIHWPEIDEDISVEGMLYGVPAEHARYAASHTVTRQYSTRKKGSYLLEFNCRWENLPFKLGFCRNFKFSANVIMKKNTVG
jgi:hypothetical protein